MEAVEHAEIPNKVQPRLTIKSLVLENFKSYAGVQEVGPFHRSFSAIVGPNGSGKSNVIDAVLFVFGKQAKTLRLNKVSQLIHHSERHPDLTEARVTVNFYDTMLKGEDYVSVEGSDFSLTRAAFKNNTSKYYVNNRSAKREEVVEILKKRGVDLDNNRFLILQFEVEQIARMKPKAKTENEVGLLEYLEDIIGTDKYVKPIDDAYKELETLNEERTLKLQRVKIIQKEKEGLEDAKNEAEAFLSKEKGIIDKQSVLFQIDRMHAEENVKEREEKANEIEVKLNTHKEEMRQYLEEAKELENVFEVENKECQKIAMALNKAKEKVTLYERQEIQLQEDTKHLKAQIKKLSSTTSKAEEQIESKKQMIIECTDEMEACKVKSKQMVEPLKKEEKRLEVMFEGIKDEVAPLHLALEEQQKQLMPFQKEIDKAQAQLDLVHNELKIFMTKSEEARTQVHVAQEDVRKLKDTIKARKTMGIRITEELRNFENDYKEQEQKLRVLAEEDTSLVQELGRCRAKADELKQQMQKMKTQSVIMQHLTSLKKKIPGIYGRLGDLGTIEDLEKYDVAISTACGRLDDIVVDTIDTAQKCVEHLRQNNLGRATFIILEKLEHLSKLAQGRIQTPPNSERLYDLVKVKKPEIRVAFYFALQDTLVTDVLDRATEIAYGQKRYRVVTLDGKVIDLSGTMSGGGTQLKRGGMTRSVQVDVDVTTLNQEFDQLQKFIQDQNLTLHNLREQYDTMERQMEDLKKTRENHKRELPKIELDVKGLTLQLKELESRIPFLEAQCQTNKQDQLKIDKLHTLREERDEVLKKCKKSAESILNSIRQLEDRIANAGGSKLQKQKEKVQMMMTEMDTANDTVTRMEVAISSAKVAIEKLTTSISRDISVKLELEKEIEAKLEVREELKKNVTEVLSNRQELEDLYNQRIEALKVFEKDFEKKKKEYNKFRNVEVDLTNQLDDEKKKVVELLRRANAFAGKLDKLSRKKQALRIDDTDDVSLPIFSLEELKEYSVDNLNAEIVVLRQELTQLKPNLGALKEWRLKKFGIRGEKG
eukprot:TRINITY_DN1587_c0_g1_i2.p1 TRINITY_DN1587_c0_g1~~TRINITY_DN1587_c0_g1_i2.p1  ORF type:complete len:1050 (-),score=291.08 TRINITY_DN1587_c0_g1_i2:738-3887(-)